MKRYMLDTDICSYIIKSHSRSILKRFQKMEVQQICISIVTYAELIYGVERSSSRRINRPVIDDFVRYLEILNWDVDAANHYGKIRVELEAQGTPIGAMDMLIAAHAKSSKAILATNNQKHFNKVKGLNIESWV